MYEIQIHPAGANARVRYLFLSRRAYLWARAAAAGVVVVVVIGFLVAPLGLQSLLLSNQLRVLRQQNRLQRDILGERAAALERLERAAAAARLRERQISLILEVPVDPPALPESRSGAATAVSVAEGSLALLRSLKLGRETEALAARGELLGRFAAERAELTRVVPAVCPLPAGGFVLTSPFGTRLSPFTSTPSSTPGSTSPPATAPRSGRPARAGWCSRAASPSGVRPAGGGTATWSSSTTAAAT